MTQDTATDPVQETAEPDPVRPAPPKPLPKEIGGVSGPEPTRYGDWEHNGIASDF